MPQFTALSFPAKVANSTVGPVFILAPVLEVTSFLVEKIGVRRGAPRVAAQCMSRRDSP